MEHIKDYLKKRAPSLSKKPRFTIVYHEARERLGLTVTDYIVIDSIHILSHSNDRYPYCTMSKDHIAKFLTIGRATVFRAIERGLKRGLLERTPEHFLRTTSQWVDAVVLYSKRVRSDL
jgi:hypothetical protein